MVIEADEVRAQVVRAVTGLPRGQRSAIVLFYLQDLPQAEVAVLLGIPVSAVKTRLHKARQTLRRHLQSLYKETLMTTSATTTEMIWRPARVIDVRRRQTAEATRYIVVMQEVDGPRQLEMWVGPFEGEAIAVQLEQVAFPRPLTYSVMANLLQVGGVVLQEVRISRLSDDIFYATILVSSHGGASREVDSRPSDALNLALATACPITIADAVLRTASAMDLADTVGAADIVAGMRGLGPGTSAMLVSPR
jgi:hypothetical protein